MKSDTDNQYHVCGYVNNKFSLINNILVRIEGGTFWLPNVKSVEINATDPITKNNEKEIIKP